jgi:Uma2 family endonuclease
MLTLLCDHTATAPVLIAEVLSPSTAAIDLGDKAAEYLQLPSLAAYLVFSEDGPKAWVWIKGEQGFPPAPAVLDGQDEIIWIPALKLTLTLPLSALYGSVELK